MNDDINKYGYMDGKPPVINIETEQGICIVNVPDYLSGQREFKYESGKSRQLTVADEQAINIILEID